MSIVERITDAVSPSDHPRREPVDTELSLDEVCDLVAVERRRLVIRALELQNERALDELAERLADIRAGPQWDNQDRKRNYVSLYQAHLPTLEEHDVIEWDQRDGTIRRGPEFDAVLAVLNAVEEVMDG